MKMETTQPTKDEVRYCAFEPPNRFWYQCQKCDDGKWISREWRSGELLTYKRETLRRLT